MSYCAFCGSKTPKFRHPKTNLLYCNNECFIGKRPREVEFQIKGSDGGLLNYESSLRLMNESELIRSLIEDTDDQIIELPIKTNTLLHMLAVLRNFDEAIELYSLQEQIELALALNYLSFTKRIWKKVMFSIFGPFLRDYFYSVNAARVYYDLPSDGGFNKSITDEKEVTIGTLKRYPRYANGIKTERPSIINFSNDQISELLTGFGIRYSPVVYDLLRKTHVRFFTVVSEIMQKYNIKLDILAQFDNPVYLEYEKELPGFRNLARLFDEESIILQERNDVMYIIRQLIKRCILDKNYSLLYKITTPEKFKEIVNDDSNMQKILNTEQKFLFLEIKKY